MVAAGARAIEPTSAQFDMAKRITASIGLRFASVDIIDADRWLPARLGSQRDSRLARGPVGDRGKHCPEDRGDVAARKSRAMRGTGLMDADNQIDGNVAARLRIVASLMPGAIAIAQPDGRTGRGWFPRLRVDDVSESE